ncbi:solute carrier family 13 member 2-like isoform X1 [Branchiostoma floridae]|uniref:Solute carrier family 13 member 2-like isoform X1 n=2 Tax=Branchiostoma floridae TaxID=7739 RepID=A0A9J7LYL8_BRAFL|nr:solute carrier family 13 member 2-like isoform X1 [Branchiostoma floridae]
MGYNIFKELWYFKKSFIFWFIPIAASPLPIYFGVAETDFYKEAACAYVVIIMAFYWMFEVVPLAVTALIPLILYPVMGVQPSGDVSKNYLKDTNVLFLGGLMVAVAIEHVNLHKRIALRVLLVVGSQPRWLMLGFMIATAFLSMWISNTATTAMMTPIGAAVLAELFKEEDEQAAKDDVMLKVRGESNGGLELETMDVEGQTHVYDAVEGENATKEQQQEDEPVEHGKQSSRRQSMQKGLMLCIAYAANIGGTATLTGTSPNLIVSEQMEILFPNSPGVDFATWFFFAAPGMVITLILAWLWLSTIFVGCRCAEDCACCGQKKTSGAEDVIRKAYDELGPISFAEGGVIFHFLLLVLLWFFRDLKFVDLGNRQAGWAYYFIPGYVTDATPAIIVSFALFMFPSKPPRFLCCRSKDVYHVGSDEEKPGPVPGLLDWPTVHTKMPWHIVLLLGGGFALADGVEKSGLSEWLGDQFSKLAGIEAWTICLIVCIGVAVFTEVASNVTATSIFIPILAKMAEGVCVNPYYLMVPAGIAASFAFMLPVATPPNAIVFSYGGIKVSDMVKTGFLMNLTSLLVLMVSINTLGVPIYNLNTFPDWAVCRSGALGAANSTINPTVMTTTL